MIGDAVILLTKLQVMLAIAAGVILFLRGSIRRRCGAGASYRAWLLVPVMMAAMLIPPRVVEIPTIKGLYAPPQTASVPADALPAPHVLAAVPVVPLIDVPAPPSAPPIAPPRLPSGPVLLLSLWGLGLVISAGLFYWRQARFEAAMGALASVSMPNIPGQRVYRAAQQTTGPALVGMRRPRIILPADFTERYTAEEQALILAHETIHLRRGDAVANGIAAALVCFGWFNPLVHRAAARFRLDQELACDEEVIRQFPAARRTYGEAMLKTQMAGLRAPIACHWQPDHPIKERIQMLAHATPSLRRRILGTVAVSTLMTAGGAFAWATQPPTVVGKPTADDPAVEVSEVFPALLDAPSGAILVDDRYDVDSIRFENTLAVIEVVPESRTDYAMTIRGRRADINQRGDTLVVDGGLPKNNRSCDGIDAEDVTSQRDGLRITLRTPMTPDLSMEGIIFAAIGETKGADLSFAGCGLSSVAKARGSLDLSVHGVARNSFSDVDGQLDLSVHGAAKAEGADVAGDADISAHGSAYARVGDIRKSADISGHGSARLDAGNVGQALDISLHGSARAQLGIVGGPADASLHGSARLDVEQFKAGLDASAHGSARIGAQATYGDVVRFDGNGAASAKLGDGDIEQMDISVDGSASVKFLGTAGRAVVDNQAAGKVYIGEIGDLTIENSKPHGPVKVETKSGSYR